VGKVVVPQYASAASAEWHMWLFKALLASLDAMDAGDRIEGLARTRFRDLAVFGEDARIPRAALHALWDGAGLAPDVVDQVIDKYVSKALLSASQRGDAVWMHDLLHYYVRAEARGSEQALHRQLVAGYAKRCDRKCVCAPTSCSSASDAGPGAGAGGTDSPMTATSCSICLPIWRLLVGVPTCARCC
jgi:hypothetical protein